jgi:hypothetical protein
VPSRTLPLDGLDVSGQRSLCGKDRGNPWQVGSRNAFEAGWLCPGELSPRGTGTRVPLGTDRTVTSLMYAMGLQPSLNMC